MNHDRHPLVPGAIGLLLGIAVSAATGGPAWPWLTAGAPLGFLALGLAFRRGAFYPWLLAAALFPLGAGLFLWQAGSLPPPGHVHHLADGSKRQISALVVRAPEPVSGGRWRVVTRLLSAEGRPAQGLLRLDLPRGADRPRVGQLVSARLAIKPFVNFANPGGFDYRAHMARQGLWARAYAGQKSGLSVTGRAPDSPGLWLESARQRLGRLLENLPPGKGRGLVRALVLGQRGELPPQASEAFAAVGAAHLLAISGLHLGLVWGLAYLLFRLAIAAVEPLALRLPGAKLAAAFALAAAGGYACLAGLSLPTIRALVMVSCLALALFINRPYRVWGGLALAALVIGLFWPLSVTGLSFQLSFLAVASILLAGGPLADWLKRGQGWWRAPAAWLAVSLVVGLAVMPLTLANFNRLSVLFLPANALLTPLVGMGVLPLALAGAGLSLLWPPAGALLWWAALWLADWSCSLAQILAAPSWAAPFMPGPDGLGLWLIYGAAAAWLLLRGRLRFWLGGGLSAAALAWLLICLIPPGADGKLSARIVDVGQGSSVILRLPDGTRVVVDGGPRYGTFDVGRGVVAPLLWQRGVWGLGLVAASHRDLDHVGGLAFLARAFSPREVWTNGLPGKQGPFGELLAWAGENRAAVLGPDRLAGKTSLGGARLAVPWPPPGGAGRKRENDNSLWLGFGIKDCWLWLPGDSGPVVERAVAGRFPPGRHLLVASHHGGRGSCTQELLEALKPQAVIFSAGCGNQWGMPLARVRARVRAAGAEIYSTSRWGMISLASDGRSWDIRTHLARPRQCPGR